MLKYKIHAVIYYDGFFDIKAFNTTLESIVNQKGKIGSGIFVTAVVPEGFDDLKEPSKNKIEAIYSDDPKQALCNCLQDVKSEYITVAEVGDVFSENSFENAYNCFNNVKGNCDAVGVYVESESTARIKYNDTVIKREGQIVHLIKNYSCHPMDLKGLFIKSNVAAQKAKEQTKGFDETKFLVDALSRRNNFAASSGQIYEMERDMGKFSPDAFEMLLDRLLEINKSLLSKENFLPLFVQDIFLQSVMAGLNHSVDIMGAYDIIQYDFSSMWDKLHLLLQNINDNVIMKFSTTRFNKLFLLKGKYGCFCGFENRIHDFEMTYGNVVTYKFSSFPIRLDLVKIENGILFVNGVCHVPSCIDFEKYSVKAMVNGKTVNSRYVKRYTDRYFYDKIYLKEVGFVLEIPLNEGIYEIRFFDSVGENICVKQAYEFSEICVLNKEIEEDYYYKEGYLLNYADNALLCRKCSEKIRQNWETSLQTIIKIKEPSRYGEIVDIRNYFWENHQRKNKEIWLVTDRPDRADDNGEAFFRYMAERDEKDIELYFVLNSESNSFEELSKIGNVIEPFSAEHKKLHLLADYIISSQMAESVYNPFNDDVKYFRGLFRNPKQVFLQHGVINNEHGGKFFSRYGRDFYGFVVSAGEEYNYMKEPKFHYNNEVWLTGLPRWDRLCHEDKRKITVMPTWRKYLTTRTFDEEAGTKIWKVNDNFTDTEYFKFYNGLINDRELLDAAEKYGYEICFMPHVIFLKETEKFDKNDRTVIYDYEKSYHEIYAESSLIVTDYSSAVFDFAYMRQPVVYCQFDREDFYAGHSYTKGYFDHKRDGFGEVTESIDELVKVLIEYMSNGCKLKPKYRKRIDDFFNFNDKNCCKRVYEKIKNRNQAKEQ